MKRNLSILSRNRCGMAHQVYDFILNQVRKGVYADKLPGIDVLADELGFNRKTVNRAILALVKEGVLVRHVGRGTFVAEKAPLVAPSGKRINSRRYAFLLNTDEGYPGYLRLLAGCDSVVAEIGGSLIYKRFCPKESPEALICQLRALRIEGVFACAEVGKSFVEAMRKEFSVIIVDWAHNDLPVNIVSWDYVQAGRQLVHSIATSRKSPIYVVVPHSARCEDGPPLESNQGLRLAGVQSACRDLGISCRPCFTDWSLSNLTPDLPVAKALRANPKDNCLICDSLILFGGVLQRLGCLGVFEQLCTGTFADARTEMGAVFPTYLVDLDMYRMGCEAARILIDIVGRPKRMCIKELLGTTVINVASDWG